jgi:DNA-binding XRE family transcriptional regulator
MLVPALARRYNQGVNSRLSLREHRDRNLLTVRELAKLAGVATQTIVNIEHGRHKPMKSVMRRIALALDVDPLDVREFAVAVGLLESGHE